MNNRRSGQIRAEAARLSDYFVKAGAKSVEPLCLQPADILLDLYGEDIRARAYVTHDPVLGEQMLRPDFTVPVVQMHITEGCEPARYTYNGPVWRQQIPGSGRGAENIQVGYELFTHGNPTVADAEVFSLFSKALHGLNVRPMTGDMGILRAAVLGLQTTERRKAALLRHLWRPERFRHLLERFGGRVDPPPGRSELIASAKDMSVGLLIASAGKAVGLRSTEEIAERVAILRDDAKATPIPPDEVALLEEILGLQDGAQAALARLRKLQLRMPALIEPIDLMQARLQALEKNGVDTETLAFEASFGRTTLEYYDGFVFGFIAEAQKSRSVIASGGRYDALTQVLGRGQGVPAVGGIIRPAAVLALRGDAT